MKKIPNKTRFNKKGVVIFVVLGAILVLGVLVTSYNFFVRGKFNESREILKHLRAAKAAQAASNYIFTQILNDLSVTSQSSRNSAADILISTSEASKLSDEFKSRWLTKIKCEDFVNSLLDGEIGNDSPSVEVKFGFFDIKTLNSLKASNNVDDSIYFYDNEKVGRLTVQVTVNIGRTREIWQETRPFKVVCPFPVPLTKFSLYWKDGVGGAESYAFNATVVGSDGRFKEGKRPFLLDNGSLLGANNTDEQVWLERGWIYVGGPGDLLLNRACGDKNFGQRFYSYPRPGIPATLMLDFPSGDGWDRNDRLYRGERLGFRVAYWGFADSVTADNSNNIWRKILKNEFAVNGSKVNYWNSSSLHIFSDLSVSNGSGEVTPSITRVIGNVYDRYLEMGYLLPVSSSNILFAAVINHSLESFARAKVEFESENQEYSEIAGAFDYVPYLYFSAGDPSQSTDENAVQWADALDSYFSEFAYSENDPNAVSYKNVMSQVNKHTLDETYDLISQYSQNQNELNLPPHSIVPRYSEKKFKPGALANTSGFENLDSVLSNVEIDKIGDVNDSTLGAKLRVCYEIKGSSENIVNALNSYFSSSSASGLDLNNLVYKVTATDEAVNLSGLRAMISPGTIYSDGAIKVAALSSGSSDENPLMLIAGKGAITVDGGREIAAYLVALGEGGSVKSANAGQKLCIRGGMAVKEFLPDNIPNQGGYLAYNTRLDPTKNSFNSFMGVAFGPKGGDL